MNIDVEETARAIEEAAARMRQAASDLDLTAKRMRKSGDLTYTAEAVMHVVNTMSACRIDLFVTRPIREFQKNETKNEQND